MIDPLRLLTLADVQEMLSISEATLRRLITNGEIGCVRIGGQIRFRRTQIETYLAEQTYRNTPEGLKMQARSTVASAVRDKQIPHPSSLPCADCGNAWSKTGPRHEYDHHLGYELEHHLTVEAVCAPCHWKRTTRRRREKRDARRAAIAEASNQ